MNTRKLGRTGISVGEIGLGCEAFVHQDEAGVKAMIDLAEQNGANYIDLFTPDPGARERLAAALKGRREKFVIQGHFGSAWLDGQYKRTRELGEAVPAFDDLLGKFGYIDVAMIHFVDDLEDWSAVLEHGMPQYLLKLKSEGKVRAIGMSSHDPDTSLAAVRSGLINVLMFSVNPAYDLIPSGEVVWDYKFDKESMAMEPKRAELYSECERLGVGVTVMKPFAGGLLLGDDSPAGTPLTVAQCIHYALTRPAVACVLSGAADAEQLAASFAYEAASDAERDYAAALSGFPRVNWQGRCLYCTHCAPCPVGIDVATVTKYFDLARRSDEPSVRGHYALLDRKAGECVECGSCEERCPFGVSVRENMRAAAALFGE